jgi:glycerol-1-phosphate dehydrogenase [NAD(P)+]
VAHFWEIHGTVEEPALDLHGILTGVASELVLHAYRRLFERLGAFALDLEERLERFAREPGWRNTLEPAIMPYAFKMDQEMAEKGELGREELRRRMSRFEANRERIVRLALARLKELGAAVETLDSAGFPFRFADLGARPEKVWLPFPYERYLRSRYTAFDLMYELGLEEEILEELGGYVDRHP